jgi:hypothetical protein
VIFIRPSIRPGHRGIFGILIKKTACYQAQLDMNSKRFQYKKGKSKRSSRGVAVENCTDIFWPKMAFPLSLAMSLAYAGKGIE